MKNVIVTGANGFIGSSLIKKLIQKEIKVLAVDISFINTRLPDSNLITLFEVDNDNLEKLVSLDVTEEYDTFYHFAWKGVNGIEKSDPYIQIKNIEMTLECARLAKKIGCNRFLCAGTIAEQSIRSLPHLNETSGGMIYGVAKHCASLLLETYCKNIGLTFVWMQLSNIYGPNNKTGNLVSYTLTQLLSEEKAAFGPALQPYDFIYLDDLLEAIYRLGKCQDSSGRYFIGSGESKVLKEYLQVIGQLCEKEELICFNIRPDDGIVYEDKMFDINPLKNLIGNYNVTTFETGIKITIDAFNMGNKNE